MIKWKKMNSKNPFLVFDIVFYRSAKTFSEKFDYEESKTFAGSMLLSIFQFLNLLSIVNFVKLGYSDLISLNIFVFFGMLLFIIVFNLIRYNMFYTFEKITKFMARMNKGSAFFNRVATIYLISSICIFLISSIALIGK